MTLKADVLEAITARVKTYNERSIPKSRKLLNRDCIFLPSWIVDGVWQVLEEQVGGVQERLFDQLGQARTELSACRRREQALIETVRELQEQVDMRARIQQQRIDG